jgi:hypothetical protein
MTHDLRDRLDDLLSEVPAHVHADATTAWRAGARRRVRRRLLAGAGVVAALAVIGGGGIAVHRATDPPPADGADGGSPTLSYPVRIEHPLLRTGTLPRDGTAVSGVVQRPDGWYAVGQHGQVWRMPGATDTDYLPAVSPDGSGLAYVRDVRDGGVQKKLLWLTDVRNGAQNQDWLLSSGAFAFGLRPHTQLFWSPDSSRVLVPVVPGVGTGEPVALLLTPNGQKDAVTQQVQGRLLPAGWYDDRTLVWVKWRTNPETGTTAGSATVILTNLHGHVVDRFPLRMRNVWTDPPDRASVSVSPGGDVLVLGADQGHDSLSPWWFHLRGPLRGHVKAEIKGGVDSRPACPTSWGDDQEIPAQESPDDAILSEAASGGPTIYADPDGHDLVAVLALAGDAGSRRGRAGRRRLPRHVVAASSEDSPDDVTR